MPRRALIFAAGSDTAGTSVRAARAFQRLASSNPSNHGWEVRSMVSTDNYIHYPVDLAYSKQNLASNYDMADVVVLNSTLFGHDLYDDGQGKPTILVHHGIHVDHFSQSVYQVIEEAKEVGARQIGTTVNLELLADPGVITWVPTSYNLAELAQLRLRLYEPPQHDGPIRVCHAPTDRKVKSTQAVIDAVTSLNDRGFGVTLTLIEGKSHAETLEAKARYADIYVDQFELGYGCNAIEAWAMGVPVVAGIADPAARAHAKNRYDLASSPTGLPFISATPENLEETLAELVIRRQILRFWADIGLEHVNRWHSDENYVKTMTELLDAQISVPTTPSSVRRRFPNGLNHAQRLEILRKAYAQREAFRAAKLRP